MYYLKKTAWFFYLLVMVIWWSIPRIITDLKYEMNDRGY